MGSADPVLRLAHGPARTALTGSGGNRRPWRRWLPLAIALLLIALVGYQATQIAVTARRAADRLHALEGLTPSSLNLAALPALLDDVQRSRADLDALRAQLQLAQPVLWPAAHLPIVGRPVAASLAAVDATAETAAAAEQMLFAIVPPLQAIGPNTDSRAVLAVLGRPDEIQQARAHLAQARADLDRAQQAAARVDRAALVGPLARFGPAFDKLDGRLPELVQLVAAADAALELGPLAGGFDRPKAYALLAQNNDELRATGGFIGSIGIVTVGEGKVVQTDFRNSYDFDNPLRPWIRAPEPLTRYMGSWLWELRDTNWSPDFSAAAGQFSRLWELDQGNRLDGVIALDEEAFRLLLGAAGPLRLPSFAEEVTSDNFKRLATVYLYQSGQGHRTGHTKFSEELGTVLVKRIVGLQTFELPKVAAALDQALREKHLLVTFANPDLAAFTRERGWDGHLPEARGDYLYVVDSNVSFGKLNPFVERDVDYRVKLDANGRPAVAQLTITYHNSYRPGPQFLAYPTDYFQGGRWNEETRQIDYREGYYGNYLRVYLPRGTRFLGASGFEDPTEYYEDQDKAVLANYLTIGPGEKRKFTFEYVPPAEPVDGGYRLFVQKQPGTDADRLQVEVTPPSSGTAATWSTDLLVDREFSLPQSAVGGRQ